MLILCLFFNDTATTEIYTYCHTLALHDALPISPRHDAKVEGVADPDLMRKAGFERQGARMAAREQVEDQAGEDDADPAGRDQPQTGPHQAAQSRRGGARAPQQDRAAGRVEHLATDSRLSNAAQTPSTPRTSTLAAEEQIARA